MRCVVKKLSLVLVLVVVNSCGNSTMTVAERQSILIEKVKEGDLPSVKEIVGNDTKLANLTRDDGTPLLYFAAANGRADIVSYLVGIGANIDASTDYGSALHIAVDKGYLNIVKILLNHNASAKLKDDWKQTPLHLTSRNQSSQIATLLISAGASVSAKDDKGRTPLLRCKSLEVAKVLVSRGADVNASDMNGYTPLHWAATPREIVDIPTIKYLISQGADLNARDKKGKTPCELAKESEKEQADKKELMFEICKIPSDTSPPVPKVESKQD